MGGQTVVVLTLRGAEVGASVSPRPTMVAIPYFEDAEKLEREANRVHNR